MSNHNNSRGAAGEKKRKLSEEHEQELEKRYEEWSKLYPERKDSIARDLGLNPNQVAIWFRNKRARVKAEKVKKEYQSALRELEIAKAEIDVLKVENHLQKLKTQLFKAKLKAMERSQRAVINRERAAVWNLGYTSGAFSTFRRFTSGMAAPATSPATVVAPANHHLRQANSGYQFPATSPGIMAAPAHPHHLYEVPEQTINFASSSSLSGAGADNFPSMS